MVPYLAGNAGRLLRLAGRPEAVAGFSRQVSGVGVRRMNTSGAAAPGSGALELPPFSLDVQALDLGGDVKAVGLELVETENREPVRGKRLLRFGRRCSRLLRGTNRTSWISL